MVKIFRSTGFQTGTLELELNEFLKDLKNRACDFTLTWLQSSENSATVLTCIVEYAN